MTLPCVFSVCFVPRLLLTAEKTIGLAAQRLKCLSMCNGKSRTYSTKKTWITFQRYSSLDMLKWDRRGVELCTFLALIMVFAMMQHSALSVAACAQIVQCLGGQANLASGAIPHSKPVTLLSSRL